MSTPRLGSPWYRSPTVISTIIAALAGLPSLIDTVVAIPGITQEVRLGLMVISALATWLAALFARLVGLAAAETVEKRTDAKIDATIDAATSR